MCVTKLNIFSFKIFFKQRSPEYLRLNYDFLLKNAYSSISTVIYLFEDANSWAQEPLPWGAWHLQYE